MQAQQGPNKAAGSCGSQGSPWLAAGRQILPHTVIFLCCQWIDCARRVRGSM